MGWSKADMHDQNRWHELGGMYSSMGVAWACHSEGAVRGLWHRQRVVGNKGWRHKVRKALELWVTGLHFWMLQWADGCNARY